MSPELQLILSRTGDAYLDARIPGMGLGTEVRGLQVLPNSMAVRDATVRGLFSTPTQDATCVLGRGRAFVEDPSTWQRSLNSTGPGSIKINTCASLLFPRSSPSDPDASPGDPAERAEDALRAGHAVGAWTLSKHFTRVLTASQFTGPSQLLLGIAGATGLVGGKLL